MKYALRPYQIETERKAREALAPDMGLNSALIHLPTGAGKTIVGCRFIELACAKGSRSLFLAPRKEIVLQTSDKLADIGISHSLIKAGLEYRFNPCSLVQVASVQTMAARLHKLKHLAFDLIITDEAHHYAAGGQYDKILQAYPKAIVLGLTATPCRLDGKGLKFFKSLVQTVTISDLIEQGWLVPILHFRGPKPDLRGVAVRRGDYDQGELAQRMNRTQLVGHAVRQWMMHAAGLRTIGFCVDRAHARHVCAQFQAAGIAAEYLDGDTPDIDRDGILARLRSGQTLLVINVGVLTEGFDCPEVACILDFCPTKSLTKFLQMCGRALRPAPGKTSCTLLDHAGAYYEHGCVDDPRAWSLEAGYVRPSPKEKASSLAATITCTMEFCGAVFRRELVLELDGVKHCPACRTPLPARQIQVDEEKDLQLVEKARKQPTPITSLEPRQHIYEQIAKGCYQRGARANVACFTFRKACGSFPTASDMAQSRYKLKMFRLQGKFTVAWDVKKELCKA